MVKIVLMPIFGFTLFGWAVGRAGGFGPVFSNTANHITDGSGRTATVVFFSAMTSAIAPKATLSLNVCDFTVSSCLPARPPRRGVDAPGLTWACLASPVADLFDTATPPRSATPSPLAS